MALVGISVVAGAKGISRSNELVLSMAFIMCMSKCFLFFLIYVLAYGVKSFRFEHRC